MKNKLLAVLATLSMVASASAVKVNDNLSINGFIDGSYSLTESDTNTGAAGDQGNGDLNDQGLGIDEVELNFVLNAGGVSGLVSIDNTQNEGVNVEQANFTYNLNDSVSLTFGSYGSALGLEGEDPAGLYTYSRAYKGAFNLADIDSLNSVEGLTVAYSAETFSIAASVEEAADADLEISDLNLELSFTYNGISGINIGGGYFFDNNDLATSNNGSETDVLNLHVSRQFGKLLLAGEYIEASTTGSSVAADNAENDGYLLLADYDVSDKLGVAVRLSNQEQGTVGDYEKFTIAPNYAITDSLGAILEYSDVEDNGNDSEEYAVELTFTF
ncbi:porin [bacterium]|nr:porin [bacterium]